MWPTLLILLPLVTAYSNNEYCSICNDHTMCRFQGVGSACGSGVTSGVSNAEAQQILQLHNKYRSFVATGSERRGAPGPQPSAADMQALIWDNDLAEVAQRWADQCIFEHDSCRNDPRFQVGQNIYWSSGGKGNQWDEAIQAWYDEVASVSGQSVENYQLDHSTGHYTQLVWAKSRLVGCGRTVYGGGYRNYVDRPIAYVLSETKNKTVSVQRKSVMRRDDNNQLGFFGGLEPNPAGAQGAIAGFGSQPSQQTSPIPNPGMIAAGSNQEPFNPGNSQNYAGYGSNPGFGTDSSPDFNLSPESNPEFGSHLGYGVNPALGAYPESGLNPGFGSNSGANSPYPVNSYPQLGSNPPFHPTNPVGPITGLGSQPPVNNPVQPPQQTSPIPNPGIIAAGSNQGPFNPGNSQNHPGYGSNPGFGTGSSPDFNLSPESNPEFGSNLGYGVNPALGTYPGSGMNPGFGSNSGANSPYPVSSYPQFGLNPFFHPTNPLGNLVQNPFLGGNVNPGLITSSIGNLIAPVVGQLLLTRPSPPVETKLKVYRLPTYAERYLQNRVNCNKTLNQPIFQQNNRQQYGLPEPKPIAPPPTIQNPMYHIPHNGPMRPIQNGIRDHSNVDKENWFNNWFNQGYQERPLSYISPNEAGSSGGSKQMLICNYGPAGNFIGSPMYTPGPPCSRCPSDTQCQNGLCT